MDQKVKNSVRLKDEFAQDVIEGLSQERKTLPCKYFYDSKGSQLFEDICELDEYYITRTELALIDQIKNELSDLIGGQATIIEPGAGAGTKIQKLLNALPTPNSYVPIDISQDFLDYSEEKINDNFPGLKVHPIQADFTAPVPWQEKKPTKNRVIFFPGSTIGNFAPEEASELLANFSEMIDDNGAMIVGFDLLKSKSKLEAAYNDKKGVTADFNLNLLHRINNELDANFDLDNFSHEAVFNPTESRIEMHLKSQKDQTVALDTHEFDFNREETIHTENSYKYSNERFEALAESAGLKSKKYWMDDEQLVSMHFLTK